MCSWFHPNRLELAAHSLDVVSRLWIVLRNRRLKPRQHFGNGPDVAGDFIIANGDEKSVPFRR
jgi:hypothetical protein